MQGKKSQFKRPNLLILFFLISIIVILVTPLMGTKLLSLSDIFNGDNVEDRDYTIFWKMRMPRTLVAFMAGAIFAISGMVFQAIFRNPLVSPFTLGVSAGASLGAAIYISLNISFTLLTIPGVSVFSFLGAALSMVFIWGLANLNHRVSTATMLLGGVAVSFLFASLIMLIQYMSSVSEAVHITRWLMGGLIVFGYGPVVNILPFAFGGLAMVWFFARELNLFTVGEELAISRGVDTENTIKILFFAISIMIGGIVSVCGPIAFVGIIAPHICRLLIGPDHRYLTPATFLFGGLLLTICDAFARTIASPAEIPVGVITALLGGPFFLWILITRSSEDFR